MRNVLLTLSLVLLCCATGFAQYPLVTIADIQAPVTTGCNDTSAYYGDTVRVRGVVIMDGGLAQTSGGRNVWIQDATNSNGLDVFGSSGTATTPDDVLDLIAGDSVEITGWIDEYRGESEIRPLNITIQGSGSVDTTVVDICDLNDNSQNNLIPTGEQYEGRLIQIDSVWVESVDYFSGGTRVSFVVRNAAGCKMNVSDRFLVQRLPANGGTFVPPVVGDFYCKIQGVLSHSKNDCPGFTGRGYELYPFDASNYEICSAAPSIFNITRTPTAPTSTDSVQICADITDLDGICSATLYYVTGVGGSSYTSVPMSLLSGDTYCAKIPPQPDGTFVKYYVCAEDCAPTPNMACNPDVPGTSDPLFYTVRDAGLTIYDVQFVPSSFSSGASGYEGMDVTVEGVVTASAESDNLGTVFIQEEGAIAWAGLWLVNDASLTTLDVGDKVTVTGTIEENFGFTRMDVSSVTPSGTGTITPVELAPETFTAYDFSTNEAYEAMLIKLANSTPGDSIYTVDANPDAPSNFAEWRVGSDKFDPANGSLAQSGRQTSSSISSLNVSYVNDATWEVTDGMMNVPVCVATVGDAFSSITGIMYYSFGDFKLLPRNNADFENGPSCIVIGKDEPFAGSSFSAYPNPATSTLNIAYDLQGNASHLTVTVYDLMGTKVAERSLDGISGVDQINVESLTNGTYLLNVRTADNVNVFNTKVVVVK